MRLLSFARGELLQWDYSSVKVKSRVNNDPGDQKTSKTGHKAFLGEFPKATVLFFVHALEDHTVKVANG